MDTGGYNRDERTSQSYSRDERKRHNCHRERSRDRLEDEHYRHPPPHYRNPHDREDRYSANYHREDRRENNGYRGSNNYHGDANGERFHGRDNGYYHEDGQFTFERGARHQGGEDRRWERVPHRSEQRYARHSRQRETTLSEPAPPEIKYIAPTDSNKDFRPFMLILCGVPGSGKSTFADSLVRGKPWMFTRVNQDTLGNRSMCEQLARDVLREGRCPVIDRCNFDLTQRKHFLSIAREYKAPVDCIVFQFDRKLCVRRCQSRQNHETVAPHIAQEVVSRMINQFSPPLPNRNDFENFRNLQTVDSLDKFNNVVTEYLNLIL